MTFTSSWFVRGSSPRLRGTDCRYNNGNYGGRFIPALAGNRTPLSTSPLMYSVHPRACGEQWTIVPVCSISCGSSPRLRGTVGEIGEAHVVLRFIPALAGNRPVVIMLICWPPVHPRACGEQESMVNRTAEGSGSSPRLRGTALCPKCYAEVPGFIPALAGNSPTMPV